MNFFINEIIENIEIKKLISHNEEISEKAKTICDSIKNGEAPTVETGILPIFVLAHLADFTLNINDKKGIPKEITVNTLKDVNIWIDNYKLRYNKLGLEHFDWLKNHYTGNLFRLGRLQFKIVPSPVMVPSGEYVIETHIPQDEPLNINDCIFAFESAKEFFGKYFPEKKPECFTCNSWLLNPNLESVLDSESNIVKFMRLWNTVPFKSDGSAQAIQRVFGFEFEKTNIENAPEETRLQKNLKKFLLSGGNMDITFGWRKI